MSHKYHTIATDLIERISKGEFLAGSKLPSEKKLCDHYSVNRHTLRKAIQQIVSSDLLEIRRGVGTFVCPQRQIYHMGASCSFTLNMLAKNQLVSENIVIESSEMTVVKNIADKLSIDLEEKVYMIKRLTKVDSVPYTLTTSYFSSKRFPDLIKFVKDGSSLSRIIREQYRVDQRRAISSFSVSMPNQEQLNLLQLPLGIPVLNVRNISKDHQGNIVEYNISDYRGDYASINVEY